VSELEHKRKEKVKELEEKEQARNCQECTRMKEHIGSLMDQLTTMNATLKAMVATMPSNDKNYKCGAERGADSGKE
jgi:hypothetical protein